MVNDNDFMIFLEPPTQPQSTPVVRRAPAVRDYYQEYMILLTASQFLTTIQKISLYHEALAEYDSSELATLATEWQSMGNQFPPAREQVLLDHLTAFRAQIEATDQHVMTANVRRLFESIGTPDSASMERVIRYYLAKPTKSAADRDKIDLLITRWGSFRIPGTAHMVVLRREYNLADKLATIFNDLDLPLAEGFQESEVLDWLARYSESLLAVSKMSDIVEKNYKKKLREFKLALEDFFYRPNVLAAIVDTNVTLHNVLQEFYLSERARLELYVDHAKRKTSELPAGNSLFNLMTRADEMKQILDQTQQAIVSQQVVDQSAEANQGESQVDKLVALLEQTLQRTNELSQQLQREIAKKPEN